MENEIIHELEATKEEAENILFDTVEQIENEMDELIEEEEEE